MGRLDKSFAEVDGTLVKSKDTYIRYEKDFNSKGNRKHGKFHHKTKDLPANTRRD